MSAGTWLPTWTAIEPVANHLWQSTIVAVVAGLLTRVLRNDRAQVRYCLWLAASVKFLVPFAALVAVGRRLPWPASATFFTAVQEQLGLRLEAQRGPVNVVVIDQAEPPTPDEFDIAIPPPPPPPRR